ncbi:hypothetical protein JCM8547_006880 [Rhodosporidiobolus lusitaniae]
MCRSTTTLIFGFCAKSLSLCAAAAAWQRLRSALLGIDLVLSRRKSGTLSVSNPKTRLADLPGEVWELVKAFSLEWPEDTPDYYDLEYLGSCNFCWREFCDSGGVRAMLEMRKKERLSPLLSFFEPLSITYAFLERPQTYASLERPQDVTNMLVDFGLVATSLEPVSEEGGFGGELDTDALTPLSFPFHTSSSISAFPSISKGIPHRKGVPPSLSSTVLPSSSTSPTLLLRSASASSARPSLYSPSLTRNASECPTRPSGTRDCDFHSTVIIAFLFSALSSSFHPPNDEPGRMTVSAGVQRVRSWRRKGGADHSSQSPPPPVPSGAMAASTSLSSQDEHASPSPSRIASKSSSKHHRRTLSPIVAWTASRNSSSSPRHEQAPPAAPASFLDFSTPPGASGLAGAYPPTHLSSQESTRVSGMTIGVFPPRSPSSRKSPTPRSPRVSTFLNEPSSWRTERPHSSPSHFLYPLSSASSAAPPLLPPAALPSPTPPPTPPRAEPSPPSPSYPFPRMDMTPPRPARPQLVSAFSTSLTIKPESFTSESSGTGWGTPGHGNAFGRDVGNLPDELRRSPSGLVAATPEKPARSPFPLTPPSTSHRNRPRRLELSYSSYNSSAPSLVSDEDESEENEAFVDGLGFVEEDPLAALPGADTLSLSLTALEVFEDQPEFPWRWSSGFEGAPCLPASPSLPHLPSHLAVVTAFDLPESVEEAAKRRRTLGNGELARVQQTLADAAVVLESREMSPKVKRSGLYVPPTSGHSHEGDEDDTRRCSLSSSVSSLSSLASLPYVPASDDFFSFSRVRHDSPHTLRSTAPSQPTLSLPFLPSPPPPVGLKSLRLSYAAPSSRSPRPAARRQRSNSVPLPYSTPPPPNTFSPCRPPRPTPAQLLCPTPLTASSGWSSSSSAASSSAMMNALCFAPEAPSSSSSSTQNPLGRPYPFLFHTPAATPVDALSTAPSSSSFAPAAAGAESMLRSLSSSTAIGRSGGEKRDEEVEELKKALEGERERSTALEEEVKRLKRVVGVLMGLPAVDSEDEA